MTKELLLETMMPVAKGKALATPEIAADGPQDLYFDAILSPNRSLSNKGFRVVMVVVIGGNIFTALYATMLGAWPVFFFAGLDIVLVWLAFKLSYRQGLLHERIMLSPEKLSVSRVLPSGHETRWSLQPYWSSILLERPERHESQLCLVSHGRRLIIGSFLAPHERMELAEALAAALARANSLAPKQLAKSRAKR